MSQTYLFKFWADLNVGLPVQEITVIKYLFEKGLQKPISIPSHSFFADMRTFYSLKQAYESFPQGSYAFDLWSEKNKDRENLKYSINISAPSLKLEEIYEFYLPMVEWFASLSVSSGYAGSFHLESEPDFDPMLLFIYENSIYLGDSHSAFSFTTGDKLSFKQLF